MSKLFLVCIKHAIWKATKDKWFLPINTTFLDPYQTYWQHTLEWKTQQFIIAFILYQWLTIHERGKNFKHEKEKTSPMKMRHLHVSRQEVWNMNPIPTSEVVKLRSASDKLMVAAFLITCVSSESRLSNSPVLVTSKNAISYKWEISAQ